MEEAKKPEEKKGQIFLQLPGVEGVSREKGYEGWLRAQTYQFGVGCGVSRGGGYGRRRRRAPPPTEGGDAPKEEEKPEPKLQISRPSVSEITVSLVEDAASPLLLHAIVNRGLFSEAVIARVDPDGKLVTRFALKEAVISGFSISSERGNGRGGISLSLNFEEFEFAVLNEEASHRVSYNINNHTTLLDGEAVPSPYVEPEGGDDDY